MSTKYERKKNISWVCGLWKQEGISKQNPATKIFLYLTLEILTLTSSHSLRMSAEKERKWCECSALLRGWKRENAEENLMFIILPADVYRGVIFSFPRTT
ncbi:hypothetical protein E2C01_031275 [Portunus trituberculatus]|uniref:Uncharacterized protein n=1 Tax=Portunus trituberculatus TaxID=210409 RepID=A0A5B7EZN0_PORTR|nr:hypothetical protein [Portunus trituberculatus]